MKIYLNLGSNLGNRVGNISRAIALLLDTNQFIDTSLIVSSPFYSKPWGFESQNRFLNMAIRLETAAELDPGEILKITQTVELQINGSTNHRDVEGRYVDRALDIDIISIDERSYSSPILELPHPRMCLRDFVALPMREIEPGWVHPVSGRSIGDICEALTGEQK